MDDFFEIFRSTAERDAIHRRDENDNLYKKYKRRTKTYEIYLAYTSTPVRLIKRKAYICNIRFRQDLDYKRSYNAFLEDVRPCR